jgi:hypothetical protein
VLDLSVSRGSACNGSNSVAARSSGTSQAQWLVIGRAMSQWLVQPGHDQAVVMLVSTVIGLVWIPGGMISLGMLSLAYRHFFEQRA